MIMTGLLLTNAETDVDHKCFRMHIHKCLSGDVIGNNSYSTMYLHF